MKSSSMLSRVFYRRPGVRQLVPDLKLVLSVLTVGCESHVGVYRPAGLSEDTGLDSTALAGALEDLARRSHIATDTCTGEVFLIAFFRDNSFRTPARRGQARDDFRLVESHRLKALVLDAVNRNPECGLKSDDLVKNHNDTQQGKAEGKGEDEGIHAAAPLADASDAADAAASPLKRRQKRPSGIVTWLPEDVPAAELLEQAHPNAKIALAVAAVERTGKSPVPGLVDQELEKIQRQEHANRIAEERKAAVSRRSDEQRVAQLADPATAIGAQIYLRRRKEASDGRP